MVKVTVNGGLFEMPADPRVPFLEVLREQLGLRGTKYGCGEGECGACTIIVDGRTVCACLALTGSLDGAEITTIEGLANDPIGVRLIDAFAKKGAVQCGFCTPGFVLSGWQALAGLAAVDAEHLRDALGGNLCRCTGYAKIMEGLESCLAEAPVSPLAARKGQGGGERKLAGRFWRPASLDNLLAGLGDFAPEPRFIAGGTDLMVQHEHRLDELALVDLSGITELAGIEETTSGIRIGATTSWTDIRHSPLVAKWAPLLPLAAAEIGGIQIQNRATIGGNLVNASPAADGVPALLVHDAEIEIASAQGARMLPVAAFLQGPGKTALRPGEMVVSIAIARRTGEGRRLAFFEKVGPRKAQTITKASVAFEAWLVDGRLADPRIALGAVAATVIRAGEAERSLAADASASGIRRAAALASAAARPIDDIRSTAAYRRDLVGGLLTRGLLTSLQEWGGAAAGHSTV